MINLCIYFIINQAKMTSTGMLWTGRTTSDETKFDVCMVCSNWHCDTCEHAKNRKR